MSCQRFDDNVEAVKREREIGSSEGEPCEADERGQACHAHCLQQTRKDGADAEGGPAQRVEPRAAARTLARAALKSQAALATTQEYDAKALLLQSHS